eukprot:scaffold544_cov117-Isochrysis_galbana.AAC.30
MAGASPLPRSALCAQPDSAGAPHDSPTVSGVDCTNETARAVPLSPVGRGRVSCTYEADAARRGPE